MMAMRKRLGTVAGVARRRRSLLWHVFAANTVVLFGVGVVLVFSPTTIHSPPQTHELIELAVLLVGMAIVSVLLLRRALKPLTRLEQVVATINVQHPGRRALGFDGDVREIAALAASFNAMLDRLEAQRTESVRRTLAAQEAERLRIARELHDEIGQTLTAVALRAERAAASEGGDPAAMGDIARTVHSSLDDLRRISRRLRPEALDDLGLVNALISLCRRVARQGDLAVTTDFDPGLPHLSEETELVIYRVAQEALTNVLRHASASRVQVSLRVDAGRVLLLVADDGTGLSRDARERTGIAGMRERALLVGAELTVGQATTGGTEVRLALRWASG